jgi:hypothetical protein
MGRNQALRFAPGDWIEITDDNHEFNGQSGELHQIDSINVSAGIITLVDSLLTPGTFPLTNGLTNPARRTRVTRWDQSGQISAVDANGELTDYFNLDSNLGTAGQGAINVPPPGTTLLLENGLTVSFNSGSSSTNGSFNTGDFWNFAARTADGSLEQLTNAPPRGIHHHYAPLSVVTFSGTTTLPAFTDCRTPWSPLVKEM